MSCYYYTKKAPYTNAHQINRKHTTCSNVAERPCDTPSYIEFEPSLGRATAMKTDVCPSVRRQTYKNAVSRRSKCHSHLATNLTGTWVFEKATDARFNASDGPGVNRNKDISLLIFCPTPHTADTSTTANKYDTTSEHTSQLMCPKFTVSLSNWSPPIQIEREGVWPDDNCGSRFSHQITQDIGEIFLLNFRLTSELLISKLLRHSLGPNITRVNFLRHTSSE